MCLTGWQERKGRKEGGNGKGDSEGVEGRWERVNRKGKEGKGVGRIQAGVSSLCGLATCESAFFLIS